MTISKDEKEFVTYVVDLMQSIGPISAKSMFGGHGIFLDGLMFGLVADSILYLKVDKETENEFKAKGLEAFTYNKKGKEFHMSYYQVPEEALEDADEMKSWANKAYGAALRAASKKRKKSEINQSKEVR
jgi:DNA transformation protein